MKASNWTRWVRGRTAAWRRFLGAVLAPDTQTMSLARCAMGGRSPGTRFALTCVHAIVKPPFVPAARSNEKSPKVDLARICRAPRMTRRPLFAPIGFCSLFGCPCKSVQNCLVALQAPRAATRQISIAATVIAQVDAGTSAMTGSRPSATSPSAEIALLRRTARSLHTHRSGHGLTGANSLIASVRNQIPKLPP